MENPTEIQFATALKEKCTVFVASDNVLLEKLKYSGIFTYLCDSDTNHTVVWVCLNHSPVAILKKFKDFGCDIEPYENQILFIDTVSGIAGSHNKNVVSCLSIKDYTELILCTHRLSNANALIVLDDLDALLSTAKPEVIEKVLKRWDQKLKEQRSSFITTITKGILDTRDENQILRLFDAAYIIDTKQMNNKRNPSECISYELQDNKLILKPSPVNELSRSYLNKLFTISPDEIDNLNSQIYREVKKYKDMI